MNKKHFLSRFVLLLCLLSPTFSFAIFCPTNFNQIEIGDSQEQVTKQCGAPNTQTETKKTSDNIPQEWSYFVPQTVETNTANQAQGTLKTTVVFDQNGKAINLSVNGIGVGASTICGNAIQLGDTKDTIESACGKPAFINKQLPPDSKTPPDIIITEFIYNTTPPVHLLFEDGKLKEKK